MRTAWFFIIMLWIFALASCHAHASNPDMSEFKNWARVMENESIVPQKRSLKEIIRRWENLPYIPDGADYWQTREQTAKRGGDCEDFAIAVYYDLVESGVSDDDLMIVVAQTLDTGEIHAYVKYGTTIIDRRAFFRLLSVKKEKELYRPLYGINRAGWVNLLTYSKELSFK